MGRKNAVFLCLAVTALVTLGLVMLTSTSVWDDEVDGYALVKKQAAFIAFGLIGAVFISTLDYKKLKPYWIPLLVGSCVLLGLCYLPGIGQSIKGEARWIKIPGLAKMALAIAIRCL